VLASGSERRFGKALPRKKQLMAATARRIGHWIGFSLALACGGRTEGTGVDDGARAALASAAKAPSSPPPYLESSQAVPAIVPTSAPPPAPAPPVNPPPVMNLQATPHVSEPPRPAVPRAPTSPDPCFDYLGEWITCENAGGPNVQRTDATDLQSCMQACLHQQDCTAVTEYFWMDRPDLGCWLYTSTCNAPAGGPWQEEDGGRQYVRTCPSP
jgi:hypothetical protein